LCCFTGRGVILYAQGDVPDYYNEEVPDDNDSDNDSDDYISEAEPEKDRYIPDMYAKGDQVVTISIGAAFPVLFFKDGNLLAHKITPPVGGSLSLAYSYFLGAHFFIGGEAGFITAFTLSENAVPRSTLTSGISGCILRERYRPITVLTRIGHSGSARTGAGIPSGR